MSTRKKQNVKSKKGNPSANSQNKKVTLEKRQAKKDVVLGTEKKRTFTADRCNCEFCAHRGWRNILCQL